MSYRNIPNILTVLRMLLVIPCSVSILLDYYKLAIVIFMLAAVTDGIDGLLARKLGCQTALGAVLDPLADKLLVVSLFAIFTFKNFIPYWFAAIVIVRELILLSGAAFYRFMFGPVIFVPTMLSKINTCLLLLLLLLSLLNGMKLYDLTETIYYLLMTILFTSIYSGIDYMIKWGVRVYKTLQAS